MRKLFYPVMKFWKEVKFFANKFKNRLKYKKFDFALNKILKTEIREMIEYINRKKWKLLILIFQNIL